jgi:hypothetical protein
MGKYFPENILADTGFGQHNRMIKPTADRRLNTALPSCISGGVIQHNCNIAINTLLMWIRSSKYLHY